MAEAALTSCRISILVWPRTDGAFRQPVCACGWHGGLTRQPGLAAASGKIHVRAVIRTRERNPHGADRQPEPAV